MIRNDIPADTAHTVLDRRNKIPRWRCIFVIGAAAAIVETTLFAALLATTSRPEAIWEDLSDPFLKRTYSLVLTYAFAPLVISVAMWITTALGIRIGNDSDASGDTFNSILRRYPFALVSTVALVSIGIVDLFFWYETWALYWYDFSTYREVAVIFTIALAALCLVIMGGLAGKALETTGQHISTIPLSTVYVLAAVTVCTVFGFAIVYLPGLIGITTSGILLAGLITLSTIPGLAEMIAKSSGTEPALNSKIHAIAAAMFVVHALWIIAVVALVVFFSGGVIQN